jgi:hypothetical protein
VMVLSGTLIACGVAAQNRKYVEPKHESIHSRSEIRRFEGAKLHIPRTLLRHSQVGGVAGFKLRLPCWDFTVTFGGKLEMSRVHSMAQYPR